MENPPEKTPNDVLAEQVVATLIAKGLVSPDKAEEVASRIASGTASHDDWTLWVDLGAAKKSEETVDGTH